MDTRRQPAPEDIIVPSGYRIEVVDSGLNVPSCLLFASTGEMFITDTGITDGNGKVLRKTESGFKLVADGFTPPFTGIALYQGELYACHRGAITKIGKDGAKVDILRGLPSFGDHSNNRIAFGPDGKMYFGQGTATNSAVVGTDNRWIPQHPDVHDYPLESIQLTGVNYTSKNPLEPQSKESATTGAYSPFGVSTEPHEKIQGGRVPSGCVMRANPDGSDLECVAWGLRNPFGCRFDAGGRLYVTDHGFDERGSRPIANSPDAFQMIRPGTWYGWPDYTAGLPVTMPEFKSDAGPKPTFLLRRHPMFPPRPVAVFTPHAAATGFDFNQSESFGPVGMVFVAELGSEAPTTTGGKPLPQVGHRVSSIHLLTGKVQNFAINKSGVAASESDSGGFERPVDAVFGPDGNLYILDIGIFPAGGKFVPKTGVLWRISRA